MKSSVGLFIAGVLAVIGVSFTGTQPLRLYQDGTQYSGAIAGRVLSDEGQPVPDAEVYAYRPTSPMGKLPRDFTDKQGNFLIENLAPGMYTVSAGKEEDGYPHIDNLFCSAGFAEAPQVAVYEQQTTPYILVQLGPKAATLVGRMIDSTTGKPPKNMRVTHNVEITLTRVDHPNYSYSTGPHLNGKFKILVPTVPFTIKASAPGYKDWRFKGNEYDNQADALQLASGEVKELIIRLHPDK